VEHSFAHYFSENHGANQPMSPQEYLSETPRFCHARQKSRQIPVRAFRISRLLFRKRLNFSKKHPTFQNSFQSLFGLSNT
jgi:hypothetical protein